MTAALVALPPLNQHGAIGERKAGRLLRDIDIDGCSGEQRGGDQGEVSDEHGQVGFVWQAKDQDAVRKIARKVSGG
jgi:hypothetical protein